MIRGLWYFLIVAVIAAVTAGIASAPGEIVATVGDTQIALSVAAALGLVALLIGLAIFSERIISFVLHGPGNVVNFWRTRKEVRGYEALSRGLLAVASGDGQSALTYAHKADKLLDKPALTLLLSAQAAKLAGDEAESGRAFRAMLAAPETHALALKGLYEHAMVAGDLEQAHTHAARALDASPATPWAFEGKFAIEARQENYAAALETLDKALGQGLLERTDARRRRAVLLTGLAQQEAARIAEPQGPRDEEDLPEGGGKSVAAIRAQALRHAIEARDLAPDLVPAAALAARLVFEDGRARRAQKIIEDGWAHAPHPELAGVFMNLFPDEAAEQRYKRARVLASRNPDHVESRVLVARSAIAARRFDDARAQLASYAEPFPTRRICLLMAEISEGMGDMGGTREWLSRSVKAPADAQWVADGYRTPDWSPVVPTTGAFDRLEWRAPTDAVMPARVSSTEEAMVQMGEAVVLPAPVPTAPEPRVVSPVAPAADAPMDRKTTAPAVAPAAPVPPAAPAPLKAAPAAAASSAPVSPSAPVSSAPGAVPAQAAVLDDIHEEIDFMPRRPDDPGPDAFDEDDERRSSW
ncbi:heme biosynthesis protein HemY [Pyruvatibacter mobilis]|uniref:heme biosynthesis protein HemY n=1 Tax=Pyruvatibacter mobilis TaxID=1712261 RepID=UPI003BACCB65